MQTSSPSSSSRAGLLAVRVTSDVIWAMTALITICAVVHVACVFKRHWDLEVDNMAVLKAAHSHACAHTDRTDAVRRGLHNTCSDLDAALKESPMHLAMVKVLAEEMGHFTSLLFPLGWFAYFLCGTVLFASFVVYRGQHQQYGSVAPMYPFYPHFMPNLRLPVSKPHDDSTT